MKIAETIRFRSILTIAGMFSIVIVLVISLVTLLSINGLNDLEHQNAELQMSRIVSSVQFSTDALSKTAQDWGNWDDTHDYVSGVDTTYEFDNLYLEAFETLDIELLIFFDSDGEVVFSRKYDFESSNEALVDNGIIDDTTIQEIALNQDSEYLRSGILSTSEGLYIIASSPILLSDASGSPAGNIVFGRLMDSDEVSYLSEIVGLDFVIEDNVDNLSLGELKVTDIDQDQALVTLVAEDLSNRGDYVFHLTIPTVHMTIFRSTIMKVIITLTAATMVLSFLLLQFLDHKVFKRLSKLNNQIQYITDQKVFIDRIPESPINDEISNIGNKINAMLDKLHDAHKEINELAYMDYLTKQPNRMHFYDLLEQSINEASTSNEELAVLFMDLDYFKMVNDKYGHVIGDELLIQITNRIVRLLNEKDTFARTGGDEFLILLREINKEQVIDICNKVLKSFEEPVIIQSIKLTVTASIGIALFSSDKLGRDDLIMRADIAMYQAKAKGKNQYCFWSKDIVLPKQ
ncbi:MAG: diguanylate cyclase [Bacilli bacterium]|nr:diguanylate cyclase [Bacilli bacterium]